LGYRRFRRYPSYSWGNPESKATRLQKQFGGATAEITRAFYAMDTRKLSALLQRYGQLYGDKAEDYARRTMPKWRSGEVKLSGQTLERLIKLVPPYLNPEKRLELLELILKRHEREPNTQRIEVNIKKPEEGLAEIDRAMNKIAVIDELAYLPGDVMDTAKWLYADDLTTARAMLAKLSSVETRALKESATREIELLKRTIRSGQVQSASYTVKTPGGNLVVSATTPSFCFVATACFGNADPRTNTLRVWRDGTLKRYPAGRRFVAWYYRNGPTLARVLASHPVSLKLTRAGLNCFVAGLGGTATVRRIFKGGSNV
jgi:hypothetical protein